MIKKNKFKLFISSIIILLPVIVGMTAWDKLPRQMATHWNINGTADGWSSRAVSVFVLPLVMLVLHWAAIAVTAADNKNKKQSPKAMGLIFWLCPFVSLFVSMIIYAEAFGMDFGISSMVLAAVGFMFVVIGNYLPKYKQNRTIGIRIKWTLENEENWNATHRFCGKVWVAGGLLFILCAFMPKAAVPYVWLALMPMLVIIPIIYSYVYHCKQKEH